MTGLLSRSGRAGAAERSADPGVNPGQPSWAARSKRTGQPSRVGWLSGPWRSIGSGRLAGSWPLAIAITLAWAVVWVATQTLPGTPLETGPTIIVGLVATLVIVWGYPSALRGPRRLGRLSAAPVDGVPGPVLELGNRTFPYLREGLNPEAASRTAAILLPMTAGTGVAITDVDGVLGSAGRDAGLAAIGPTARAALDQGRAVVRRTETGTEVAAPLTVDDRTVGSLVVAFDGGHRVPSPQLVSQMENVAGLVSLHLELADLNHRAQSAADARLQALRAQINPHFLFNTLNTIAAKSRTDSDETRQLLQRLADFFRYAIQQNGQFAEFAHEYFFVRTYLSLEKARYEDRLQLHYDVDPQVLPARVPVLTIQPLVENAVKHGLAPKAGGGTVTLKARLDPLARSIKILVRDDGMGMEPEVLRQVVDGTYRATGTAGGSSGSSGSSGSGGGGGGVALRNIHERLEVLYGARYRLDLRSSPGKGTSVELDLPL